MSVRQRDLHSVCNPVVRASAQSGKQTHSNIKMQTQTGRERHTERQRDRGIDRDRDRQTDRQRQKARETDRQTEPEPYIQTYRHTDRQTDRQAGRQTDRQTDRQTGKQTNPAFVWVGSFGVDAFVDLDVFESLVHQTAFTAHVAFNTTIA